MALSDMLKEIYSSNTSNKRFYDTVEISHTNFSKTYYLVKDSVNHSWQIEDTSVKEFISYPFDIKLPEAGSPQQDINFVFDNTSLEIMQEIEAASENTSEAIKLKYRVYIDGDVTPQNSLVELSLTNIVADAKTISGTASRPDLFKKKFPSGNKILFDKRFKGLFL